MKALSEKMVNIIKSIREMNPNTKVTIREQNDETYIDITKKENMFQSRKGQVFLIGIVFGTVLIFFGKLDGTQWITLFMALAGIYTAANIGERYVDIKK